MLLGRSPIAIFVLSLSLTFMPGCNNKTLKAANVPVTITAVMCGDGSAGCCAQSGMDADGKIKIGSGDVVSWSFPPAASPGVSVAFPAGQSPFPSASYSGAGSSATSGAANGSAGTYGYQGLTWNNGQNSCKNVGSGPGQLGIIMR